jgi:hypothetical protein
MPIQTRSYKRLRSESETHTSMSESEAESQSEAVPLETMEIPNHTVAVLNKLLKFYGPYVTKYLSDCSTSSVQTIMYIPFLGTLGVGPNIRDEDSRPPELKGVPLYDIIKGSTYTALLLAKGRLIRYYSYRQTRGDWPETLYPAQTSTNVPWYTRVDALETRKLIEDGIDWFSKSNIPNHGPLFTKHTVGLWRALETALQTSALLDCLRTYDFQQHRMFRGIRQIRSASRINDYYAYSNEPETATTVEAIIPPDPTPEPPASTTGGPSVESQNVPTTSNTGLKRPVNYGHPGIAPKTIKIVRPNPTVYDGTRFEIVAVPHSTTAALHFVAANKTLIN